MRALPITPGEYWESSLAEMASMLGGALEREQREWQRAAWMTAHLMNISGKELKREVTPGELLGEPCEREPVRPEAIDESVEELLARQHALAAKRAEG